MKLRDARNVIPDRVAIPKATADATLAADLVALIDLPLTDKRSPPANAFAASC